MIHFKLDSNWKILSVIRCSNSHATLSVQHIYSGEIKVLSIYAKEHFQHKLYFDISHIKHRHLLPISQIQLKHGWRLVYFPMLTPLKDYIHSNALSLSDILSLAHQLCSALEILHQHNILHLDVSPRPDMFFKTIGIIISRHILHLLNISFSSHPFNRICTALPFSYLVCFTME